MAKVEKFEVLLDRKACVEQIRAMYADTIAYKALWEILKKEAPFRVYPGGRRRMYRLSEVLPVVQRVMEPQAPNPEEGDRAESLHRSRRSRKSA